MPPTLMKMLFPNVTATMPKEAETLFLAVLRAVFEVRQEGESTQLTWRETLPGRYRQAGRQIQGPKVAVLGQVLLRQHVIWAILSGRTVTPDRLLRTAPVHNGDPVKRSDARTWRMYEPAEARILSGLSRADLQALPYIDHHGNRVGNRKRA